MKNLKHTLIGVTVLSCSFSAQTSLGAPSLTIYNDNFAVVRDAIELQLKKGVNQVNYHEITQQLEPDSVVFRPLKKERSFSVLEQNYLALPVNQMLLLHHFEGKEIEFEIDRNGKTETLSGSIIRSGIASGTPIIEMNGKTRFGLPGTPLFPPLQDDALLKPTLNIQLESTVSGKVKAELVYITGGLSWKADYNLIANEKNDQVDLNAWVTFNNQSGKNFNSANVKLMAGDINKISPQPRPLGQVRAITAAAPKPRVTEKDFDEYHLYNIERAIDLNNGESKQVEFIRASGIRSKTRYIYNGANIDRRYPANMEHIRNDPNYGVNSNPKVWIYREFDNNTQNGLGIPLPKGRVRFYQQDSDLQLEFLGENNIDHSAKDATISLYTGNAFDVSGQRKQLDYELHTRENRAQESFAITVKNGKKKSVAVTVVEPLYRWSNWVIKSHSETFTKTGSQTIEFNLELQPQQEKTIKYTVDYSW